MNRYKNDKEIEVMTNLVSAYQKKEIGEFERILKGKKELAVFLSLTSCMHRQTTM